MSEASEQLKKDRRKIIQAFAEAVDTPKEKKEHLALYGFICLCLICTMLPAQQIVTFFSLMAVLAMLFNLVRYLKKQINLNIRKTALVLMLTTTSILSGCMPLFHASTNPEILNLIRDRDYQYHVMQKYSIFGIGMDDLSIESVQFEGNIDTVYVAKIEQGFGIISLGRITVAGK